MSAGVMTDNAPQALADQIVTMNSQLNKRMIKPQVGHHFMSGLCYAYALILSAEFGCSVSVTEAFEVAKERGKDNS